jgi:hypothetical protein
LSIRAGVSRQDRDQYGRRDAGRPSSRAMRVRTHSPPHVSDAHPRRIDARRRSAPATALAWPDRRLRTVRGRRYQFVTRLGAGGSVPCERRIIPNRYTTGQRRHCETRVDTAYRPIVTALRVT